MEKTVFSSLAAEICEIVDKAAIAKVGGKPCFYESQSISLHQNTTTPRIPDLEYSGFCIIRYIKSALGLDACCTLHFKLSADGSKMILSASQVTEGFVDALKAVIEQFVRSNSDLVELGAIEKDDRSAKKGKQNQRSEVSCDERLRELRSWRSSDILYICYWAGISIVTLTILVGACVSSIAPLIVKVAAGLGLLIGVSGIFLASGNLNKRNKEIAELTATQETAGEDV